MKTELELAAAVKQPLDVARPAQTVADMLRLVVDKGISSENVAAFKELVQLHREEIKLNAEKEFAAAFVRLQRQLPVIMGGRGVPDKHGNIKYKYANFEDIDAIVRPLCLDNDFSYSFREGGVENGRITTIMTLTHAGGHSREIPYSVRIGAGPPNSTEPQADGAAHTYGQRGAMEKGLALRIVGDREDARMEGGPVMAEQADELERRVALLNQPHDKFLKWLGARTYKDIPASKYEQADEFLSKKEQTK